MSFRNRLSLPTKCVLFQQFLTFQTTPCPSNHLLHRAPFPAFLCSYLFRRKQNCSLIGRLHNKNKRRKYPLNERDWINKILSCAHPHRSAEPFHMNKALVLFSDFYFIFLFFEIKLDRCGCCLHM